MSTDLHFPEVLTLDETATYLRVPPETIEQQAQYGYIPGRQVARSWRFLRKAIDDWLRGTDSHMVFLQQAGALAEDETLPTLLQTIYAERGRLEEDTPMEL